MLGEDVKGDVVVTEDKVDVVVIVGFVIKEEETAMTLTDNSD